MCVGVSLCVGGLVGGLVWGAGGDWLLSKKWQLCWVYLLCGLAQVVYHTWAKQLSASTTLPPSFKTDPQKKLTVPFFLVVTSIIKTIICIFFYSIRVFEERYHSAQDIFLKILFSATTVKAFCIYSFLEKMKNLSDTVRRVLTGKHVQLVVQQAEGGRAST